MTRYQSIQKIFRKGPELAQVGFDPAALFHACKIHGEISLDKYGIKRSRKGYSTNICNSNPCIYLHVKMISHYASVNFYVTHTVEGVETNCSPLKSCSAPQRS